MLKKITLQNLISTIKIVALTPIFNKDELNYGNTLKSSGQYLNLRLSGGPSLIYITSHLEGLSITYIYI